MPSGRLWLIPTPLGAGSDPRRVLPADTLAAIEPLDYFVVENARTARAFLKAVGTRTPLQALELRELSEHTPADEIPRLLAPIVQGRDGGLLSEAGVPAIADPGAALVAAAHSAGVAVRPLIGPSSLLLALMASGLDGQRFAFVGYVATQPAERLRRLRELEQRSRRHDETILMIETPYRNQALLDAALKALSPDTRLLVASDLSLATERVVVDSVAGWRDAGRELPRTPSVFGLFARSSHAATAPHGPPSQRRRTAESRSASRPSSPEGGKRER
jgi:16S rRNA (cytidine1402-2'-O)-methyltransferase